MFLLLMIDIHKNLDNTSRLYADDALLHRGMIVSSCKTSINQLLGPTHRKRSLKSPNATRCFISREKESLMTDYYIDDQKLSTLKNHPYLGVMISIKRTKMELSKSLVFEKTQFMSLL